MQPISIKIILFSAAVITLLILFSLAQEMNHRLQVRREIVRLESEVNALEKKLVETENLNQYFKTDDFVELMAREKLNYQAAGEKVVLIPSAEDQPTTTTEKSAPFQKSIPQKWWDAFFTPEDS